MSRLVVEHRDLTHPDAVALTLAMVVEVSALYGTPPERNDLDPAQFRPPHGEFVVGYLDAAPIACAGFRRITQDLAQLHRVYVAPAARSRGVSRQLLELLEESASEAGYATMRLETGIRQPAATRLYVGLGYTPIPCFPPYENDPTSRCYDKTLTPKRIG